MEFEPIEAIFMVIWCFFLFKAIFGGRRKTKLPELPKEEPTDISSSEEAGGYDYEKLRRKIRKSWGEESEPEIHSMDVEKEVEKDENKSLYSSPVSATMNEKLKLGLKIDGTADRVSADVRKWQAALSRKPTARVKSKVPAVETVPIRNEKEWTAADAKKWIAYEAVFGAPRSKKPWQPVNPR